MGCAGSARSSSRPRSQCALATTPRHLIRQLLRISTSGTSTSRQKPSHRLRREAIRRGKRHLARTSARSKRKLSSKDSDARQKIDMARVTGADGKAGQLSSQMDARVRRAQSRLDDFEIKRRYETSFWLEGLQVGKEYAVLCARGQYRPRRRKAAALPGTGDDSRSPHCHNRSEWRG